MKKENSLKLFDQLTQTELENILSGKMPYKKPMVIDFSIEAARVTCSDGATCNPGTFGGTSCNIGKVCDTGTVVVQ